MSNESNLAIAMSKGVLSYSSTPSGRLCSCSTTGEDLVVRSFSSPRPEQTTQAFIPLLPEIRELAHESLSTGDNKPTISPQSSPHIDMETRHSLYRGPSSFDSQAKLFAWIDKSRIAHLNRTQTIKLRLTDVDLMPLLDTSNSTPRSRPRPSIWSLYRNDLERLGQALSSLPNLSSLTVIPPRIGNSVLLRNLYHSFLAEIPRRCPRLRYLEIHDSSELLEAVPGLKEVRCVTFTVPRAGVDVKAEDLADSRADLIVDTLLVKKESS